MQRKFSCQSVIILLYPNDDHTYVTSHLVDTSFKLINDFFHVNQGVLCFEHAEQASSSSVIGGGGGGGGATGLLNKGGGATGFLWNFHRYRLVIITKDRMYLLKRQCILCLYGL